MGGLVFFGDEFVFVMKSEKSPVAVKNHLLWLLMNADNKLECIPGFAIVVWNDVSTCNRSGMDLSATLCENV